MVKQSGLFCLLIFMTQAISAQVQWRNDRTGIYQETELLKEWPAAGPELLWHINGLGDGYSSVSIDKERMYITGCHDAKGYLYVLGMDGKLQHKVCYGDEWVADGYPGARSTVMHNDGRLYIVNGLAELLCYDAQTLKPLWKKNYAQEYAAENTKHGWNGPVLFVGDKLIIAPGGREHHIVALNKTTGEHIWSARGATDQDMSGYATPIYIGDQPVPQIAAMMSGHIIGVDAANGTLLWSHPHTNRFGEHPNTPVYHDGMLFGMSSYGLGSVMLRLTNGGRSVEKVWEYKGLSHKTGNTMLMDGYIYGSGDRANWHCVDWLTGKHMYSDSSLGVGSIIAADGLMYCYSEKGEMALVKPNAAKFDIISRFPITLGTAQHWAHPVIYQGVMYVRHGDALMAYKIR
jgi:outer membrane protein assembly factor BamB